MVETRANEFDARVGKLQMLKAIELSKGPSVLDLGCGIGQFTPMLYDKFERVVGLDGSAGNIEIARKTVKNSNHEYFVGLGESFQLSEKFDTILMTMILEHVDEPVNVLKNAKKHLKDNGRIIIQVPNANSINRRLGKYMGLIKDIHELNQDEIEKYGHKRVYDIDLLISDLKSAMLRVVEKGGIVFKPFTNSQMQLICEGQSEEWVESFVNALYMLGNEFPMECTAIYVVAC